MLAARTCSSVGLPAARREKRDKRGSTARMRPVPPSPGRADDAEAELSPPPGAASRLIEACEQISEPRSIGAGQLQLGVDIGSDQPRPDGALMVGGVAGAEIPVVA